MIKLVFCSFFRGDPGISFWRQFFGVGEGIWWLSCHSLESRSRVRGFSSEGRSWTQLCSVMQIKALKEPVPFSKSRLARTRLLGATVPAGVRSLPAAPLLSPSLLHSCPHPKESWLSCRFPGDVICTSAICRGFKQVEWKRRVFVKLQ